MTIRKCVSQIAHALRKYSDAPELDADRIVLHVLGQMDSSYLLAHALEPLSDRQVKEITRMVLQRKTGMPLAYILGEADFYGRTFIVTPDVLIPRPDTETLIETALDFIRKNFSDRQEITIADIGTGSGCIAITLALELNKLIKLQANEAISYHLIATDISAAALAIAKQNAKKHGVLEKIEFIQRDMLNAVRNKHIDLIVSNPPYIPSAELNRHPGLRAGIQKNVNDVDSYVKPGMTTTTQNVDTQGLDFEPRIALDGGIGGQKFVRQIQESGIPVIIETTGGKIIVLERDV